MSDQSLVSIVMPVHNGEAFISQAIESVIGQTYPNWELIIVDDGSTDGSRDIIEEFQDRDDRIVGLVNHENLGISASRNKSIDASKGEWIAFLDCDDQWEETKLKKQLEAADLYSTGFVFTGVSYINDEGQTYKSNLQVPQRLTYRELRNHNIIACSSVLARKEYFDQIKIARRDILDDFPLWLMILKSGVTAHGVNEPLLIYRLHRDATSRNKWRMLAKTYGAFKYIGLSTAEAAYRTSRHALASSFKHFRIRTGTGNYNS